MYSWNEQDLAIRGKQAWTDYCIHQHYLESNLPYTSSGCETKYYARRFYADNQVPVSPPIKKVQSSAQSSAGEFSVKVADDYLQNILNNDVDGNGLSAYNWLTSKPLERLTGNGRVWIGIHLPATNKDDISNADLQNGEVLPPRWFTLKASDVLDWVEKEGDIKNGQFSQVLYKATYPEVNAITGFVTYHEAIILYKEDEIITYNESGRKELDRQENSLGIVPIALADIEESLIGEGVQYSKKAVEISSLSMCNIRDSYFNIPQALGFKLAETGATTLNSDTLIQTPEAANKIEFASPNTAPEGETREQIKALQEKLDNSVQQAHTNYSTSGATIGSGVALKEQGSHQAASVKFIMDMLLEKFKVTIYFAQKGLNLNQEVALVMPENYQFESETDKIDSAEALDALVSTALSKESKKAINAKKLEKLFPDSEFRSQLIEADNAAIDAEQEVPTFTG